MCIQCLAEFMFLIEFQTRHGRKLGGSTSIYFGISLPLKHLLSDTVTSCPRGHLHSSLFLDCLASSIKVKRRATLDICHPPPLSFGVRGGRDLKKHSIYKTVSEHSSMLQQSRPHASWCLHIQLSRKGAGEGKGQVNSYFQRSVIRRATLSLCYRKQFIFQHNSKCHSYFFH